MRLEFHDTHGSETRKQSLIPQVARNTDLCYLVYANDMENSWDSLAFWRQSCEGFSVNNTVFETIKNCRGTKPQDEGDVDLDTDFDELLLKGVKLCIDRGCYQIIKINEKIGANVNKKDGCCM